MDISNAEFFQIIDAGWKIAIPAMTEGSTWEFYVPADQAYGERGSGPIPPYSTLVFKITLVRIH